MTAWKPHPLLSAAYFVLLVVCAQSSALARGGGLPHDEPWNPEHIDSLPAEVRNSVLHMCRVRPNAAHYFATYLDCGRVIKLHFEHFDCEGRQMYRKGTFACMRSLCCQVRSIGKRETTTVDVTIEPARNAATLEYLPSLNDDKKSRLAHESISPSFGSISTKLKVSTSSPLSLRNSPSKRTSPIGRDGPLADIPTPIPRFLSSHAA